MPHVPAKNAKPIANDEEPSEKHEARNTLRYGTGGGEELYSSKILISQKTKKNGASVPG